jgi:hypothetical protein
MNISKFDGGVQAGALGRGRMSPAAPKAAWLGACQAQHLIMRSVQPEPEPEPSELQLGSQSVPY